jgi:hypothetical protein
MLGAALSANIFGVAETGGLPPGGAGVTPETRQGGCQRLRCARERGKPEVSLHRCGPDRHRMAETCALARLREPRARGASRAGNAAMSDVKDY